MRIATSLFTAVVVFVAACERRPEAPGGAAGKPPAGGPSGQANQAAASPSTIAQRLSEAAAKLTDQSSAEDATAALKILDAVIVFEPTNDRAYFLQAVAHLKLGNKDQAAAALAKVRELKPNPDERDAKLIAQLAKRVEAMGTGTTSGAPIVAKPGDKQPTNGAISTSATSPADARAQLYDAALKALAWSGRRTAGRTSACR